MQAEFVPFTAQTRMSGVNSARHASFARARSMPSPASLKSRARRCRRRCATASKRLRAWAARRWSSRKTPPRSASSISKTSSKAVSKDRLARLRAMGIRTIMITGDNPLTAAVIAREAGVDDFLAEAKPKDKMDLIKREQGKGKLVAMTGDGTNDAPALAQADVGVAMNSGTQAAKEAGNMVDLDSNPTKLIEIVEIGKQLLMTRGALTTFSIANDVAKYFAIIPAMFAGVFPVLNALNIMHLHAAVGHSLGRDLQRPDHRGPDSAGAARRQVRAQGRASAVAPQPADLRSGRRHRPLHRHQTHRRLSNRPGLVLIGAVMLRSELKIAIRFTLLTTVLLGILYPLAITALGHLALRPQADGELIVRDGQVTGSRLIGQNFSTDRYFHGRPSAAGNGYDATSSGASNYAASNQKLITRIDGDVAHYAAENKSQPVPIDLVTASGSGLDPDISPAAALFQANRVAECAPPAGCDRGGPRPTSRGAAAIRSFRRRAGERTTAQYGSRPAGTLRPKRLYRLTLLKGTGFSRTYLIKKGTALAAEGTAFRAK